MKLAEIANGCCASCDNYFSWACGIFFRFFRDLKIYLPEGGGPLEKVDAPMF